MITPKQELEKLYKALENQESEFGIAIAFAADKDDCTVANGRRAVAAAIRCDHIRHAISFLTSRQMIALRER